MTCALVQRKFTFDATLQQARTYLTPPATHEVLYFDEILKLFVFLLQAPTSFHIDSKLSEDRHDDGGGGSGSVMAAGSPQTSHQNNHDFPSDQQPQNPHKNSQHLFEKPQRKLSQVVLVNKLLLTKVFKNFMFFF